MLLLHVENSSEVDLLLWLMSSFGLIIFAAFVVFVLWFFPWVLVLQIGLLVYFPYDTDGVNRFVRVTGPLSQGFSDEWVPSKNIPKTCKNALVAAEDTRFFEHPGIDVESIEKNIDANKKRKKVRGGSTITQQIVKNAFLSRERSYVRKAREISGALLLDVIMSKEKQLTWYFNIVEFGPKLYGIRAAAKKYFAKKPQDLSLRECVSLVAILPSPKKWNASLTRKSNTQFMDRRIHVIESRMRALGYLGKTHSIRAPEPQLEDFDEPVPNLSNNDEFAPQSDHNQSVEPEMTDEIGLPLESLSDPEPIEPADSYEERQRPQQSPEGLDVEPNLPTPVEPEQ